METSIETSIETNTNTNSKNKKILTEAMNEYLEHCSHLNYSKETIRVYKHRLEKILEMLIEIRRRKEGSLVSYRDNMEREAKEEPELEVKDLNESIGELLGEIDERYRTSVARAQYLLVLRSLAKYFRLTGFDVFDYEIIGIPKNSNGRNDLNVPSKADLEKIYSLVPHVVKDQFLVERVLILLRILETTGLRISEALQMRPEDVNLTTRRYVVRGKGGKTRFVFLSDKIIDDLVIYLEKYKNSFCWQWLFPSVSPREEDIGKTLSPNRVQKIIKEAERLAKREGYEFTCNVTPHSFRRFFATELIRFGVNLYNIQKLLGHSKMDTTTTYLKYCPEIAEIEVRKYFNKS